jgi:hypothetical protein
MVGRFEDEQVGVRADWRVRVEAMVRGRDGLGGAVACGSSEVVWRQDGYVFDEVQRGAVG